jgi:hypothetical protein
MEFGKKDMAGPMVYVCKKVIFAKGDYGIAEKSWMLAT